MKQYFDNLLKRQRSIYPPGRHNLLVPYTKLIHTKYLLSNLRNCMEYFFDLRNSTLHLIYQLLSKSVGIGSVYKRKVIGRNFVCPKLIGYLCALPEI